MNQRNRLIINVMSNYAAFVVYGVANFFLVWYSVHKIGAESFGLLSLILSLVTVSDILIAGICQSLTKHLAADLSQNNTENINGLVNTSIVWFSICGFIASAVLFILAFYLDRLFDIPPELSSIGRWAMILMAFKTLIMFPFTTFQGILWALQRYDLANTGRIVSSLFRIVGVVVYFELIRPGVIQIVIVTIVGFLIERVIWLIFSLRFLPKIKFGFCWVSERMMVMLLGFGFLLFIIHVANLLGYEAVKWVIGSKLSLTDVGGYTIIATLTAFVGSLVWSISNVLMPAASHLDAQGRQADLQRLAFISTKYAMTVSTGLCIVPIFLLEPFLTLWMGKEYPPDYLHTLSVCGIILLAGQWLITMPQCMIQMLTGIGRVKIPAVATSTWAVLGLGFMWLSLHFGRPSLLVSVVIITVARLSGALFLLYYGFRALQVNPLDFIVKSLWIPCVGGLLVCMLSWGLSYKIDYYRIDFFFMVSIATFISFFLFFVFFILDIEERSSAILRIKKLFMVNSNN